MDFTRRVGSGRAAEQLAFTQEGATARISLTCRVVLGSVEVGAFSAGFEGLEDGLDPAAHAFPAGSHRRADGTRDGIATHAECTVEARAYHLA